MNDVLTPAHIIFLTLSIAIDEMDMDAIFAHAGVSPQLLMAPDGMISGHDVAALSSSARILMDDPAFALHLGEEVGVEMLDVVGMMLSTAPDLRTALYSGMEHSRLVSTLGRCELLEEGDEVRMVLHLVEDPGLSGGFSFTEVAGAIAINMFRRLVKGEFRLRELHCRHAEPLWVAEYQRVFGEETRLRFDAPENCFVFDRAFLDLPMARHSPGLYQHLRTQAALRLASRPEPESTAATVQRLIRESLGLCLVDLPLIADGMGLSPRSLQRRLREENTNFVSLLEASRFQRAREQLSGSDMAVDSLAAHLGYSEPANFYRAFKAWSGLTPSEYRQRHRVGPMPVLAQGF